MYIKNEIIDKSKIFDENNFKRGYVKKMIFVSVLLKMVGKIWHTKFVCIS